MIQAEMVSNNTLSLATGGMPPWVEINILTVSNATTEREEMDDTIIKIGNKNISTVEFLEGRNCANKNM